VIYHLNTMKMFNATTVVTTFHRHPFTIQTQAIQHLSNSTWSWFY